MLVERLATKGRAQRFEQMSAAGIACGPINSVGEGIELATKLRLDPFVVVGDGDHAVPTVRDPPTFSRTPVRHELPPPELDEHGAEIRAWLFADQQAGRSVAERTPIMPEDATRLDFPT